MNNPDTIAKQLRFEPAITGDLEVLSQVHDDAFAGDTAIYGQGPPGYQKPEWHQAMFANHSYYKLQIGEQIVGGIIVIVQEPGNYLLNTLFVHPDFHGKGIGQQALQLLDQAYPQAERWMLFTPYRSYRNQRFYEKQGFTKIGEEYITDEPGLIEGFHLFIYEKRREAAEQ